MCYVHQSMLNSKKKKKRIMYNWHKGSYVQANREMERALERGRGGGREEMPWPKETGVTGLDADDTFFSLFVAVAEYSGFYGCMCVCVCVSVSLWVCISKIASYSSSEIKKHCQKSTGKQQKHLKTVFRLVVWTFCIPSNMWAMWNFENFFSSPAKLFLFSGVRIFKK